MATRTYAEFIALVTSRFPDNTSRLITESIMRDFGTDIADSFLFSDIGDGVYTAHTINLSGSSTYTGTPAYDLTTGYTDKFFFVKSVNASAGPSTLNIGSVGAKKMYKTPSSQIDSGDLNAGQIYIAVYSSTLDSGNGGFLMIGWSTSGGGGGSFDGIADWDFPGDAFPTTPNKIYRAVGDFEDPVSGNFISDNTWFCSKEGVTPTGIYEDFTYK